MMATYSTHTSITLTSTFLKSTRRIQNDVRRVTSVPDTTRHMYTAQAVHMSAFPTAVTLTTWLTATCIIHMGIIVMITGLFR